MSDPGAGVPALHVVTDDAVLERPEVAEMAERLLTRAPGPVALHLRGPRSDARRIYELALRLATAAAGSPGMLVVNDRVDIALALPGTGVHLGERSLPVPAARALLGPGVRIGASVHAAEDAGLVAAEGASWIFAGTVWETPGHPEARPCGPEGLAAMAAAAGPVPVLAIGGVTPERAALARAAGAAGVAVVRGVWDATDPVAAAAGYLESMERSSPSRGSGNR